MGKALETKMVNPTQTSNTPKKKRGRPSHSDLHNRSLLLQQHQPQLPNPLIPNNPNFTQNPNQNHLQRPPRRARSSRCTPNLPPDFVDGSDYDIDDDFDDDDRVQKKVKLVGRLPDSHHQISNSDISNAIDEDEKGSKGTDTQQNGTTMLNAGPTTAAAATSSTPLPENKKLLLLVLEKLQKKDTRGVFAEPVDPEELPDYHEVIENPMDFGTVRKKLDGGLYMTLEQFEADINLICSNAMEYNAPSTIFFRQARSIQELAMKDFEALRQDAGNSDPLPRPRRGRPPGSRNTKKILESTPLDRGARESSSDATPASLDDDAVKSNSYNLRKGPSLYRYPRNLETSFDFTSDSITKLSASKSMPVKYGEKQYDFEESKRETYDSFGECGSGLDPSLLSIFGAFDKKLTSVGLDFELSYVRSLTQFAMGLGPVVWRIVSKKIRSVLPPDIEFGPGWVGESKSVQSEESFRGESEHYPSTSGFANPSLANNSSSLRNPKNDWSSLNGANGVMGPLGSGFHFQEGMANPSQASKPRNLSSSRMHPSSIDFHGTSRGENDNLGTHGVPYWQNLSIQERWDLPYQADQSTRFQASDSRSSSLPIGSPTPLDLVLQL